MSLVQKLQLLVSTVAASMIEREAEVRAIMLGILSESHTLLVGIPGIAKSHLCRAFRDAISGMRYFEVLLNGDTDPQDVFGPIDNMEYRQTGRLVHHDENFATKAHFALFDEFFRAGPCVSNSLLNLLGPERQTMVDGMQVKTPLIAAVGASNTWSDSTEQQAIFDRWLIRRTVKTVSRANIDSLVWDDFPVVSPVVSLDELQTAIAQVKLIQPSQAAREAFGKIIDELHSTGIHPSPRRLRASAKVARASAFLEGHTEIEPSDFECLTDVLWDQPGEQADKAGEIITRIANPVGAQINLLLSEVDQIVTSSTDASTRMLAIKKLEDTEKQAQKLIASGNGRASKALQFIQNERVKLQAAALGIDPAKLLALSAK